MDQKATREPLLRPRKPIKATVSVIPGRRFWGSAGREYVEGLVRIPVAELIDGLVSDARRGIHGGVSAHITALERKGALSSGDLARLHDLTNHLDAGTSNAAFEAVAAIADPRSVDVLMRGLQDKPPARDGFHTIPHYCAVGLGKIGRDRLGERLEDIRRVARAGSYKTGAIDALGRLRDRESVPFLMDALREQNQRCGRTRRTEGEEGELRNTLIRSLGLIGDKRAVVCLLEYVRRNDQCLVENSIVNIARQNGFEQEPKPSEHYEPTIEECLSNLAAAEHVLESPELRIRYLLLLFVPELCNRFSTEEKDRAIREVFPRYRQHLDLILHELGRDLSNSSARFLIDTGRDLLGEPVLQRLRDIGSNQGPSATAAITTLWQLHDPSSVDFFIANLHVGSGERGKMCANALAEIGQEQIGEARIREIRDMITDPIVVEDRTRYLPEGEKRVGVDLSAAPEVVRAQMSVVVGIAQDIVASKTQLGEYRLENAAICLGRLGDTDSIPQLLGLYSSATDGDVKNAARGALMALGLTQMA